MTPENAVSISSEQLSGNKHDREIQSDTSSGHQEEKEEKDGTVRDPTEIPKLISSDLWSDNPSILASALKRIHILCFDDNANYVENRKLVISLGGHTMIVAALKKNLAKHVQYCGLFALSTVISSDDETAKNAVVTVGVMEIILNACKIIKIEMDTDHQYAENGVVTGMTLLQQFVGDSKENAYSFISLKGVRKITELISLHCGKQLHLDGLRVLDALAQFVDFRAQVLQDGGAFVLALIQKFNRDGPVKDGVALKALETMKTLCS